MKQIWKWYIPVESMGKFTLKIPEDAQFLTCQVQYKVPVVWAVVSPNAREKAFNCRVIGTGSPFDRLDGWTYIGTFQQLDGAFIGHLFIRGATKL